MTCSRSRGGVLSHHALQVVSQHALQHVWGGLLPGGLLRGVVGAGPEEKATAANGTHPTGMHFC